MDHHVVGMTVRIEETPRRSAFEVLRAGERIAAGFMEFDKDDGLPDMTLTEGDLSNSIRSLVHKLWQDLQQERFGNEPPTLVAVPIEPA